MDDSATSSATPPKSLDAFQVIINSGLLSTQLLSQAIELVADRPASPRALVRLIHETGPITQPEGQLRIVPYELTDGELIDVILQHADRGYLILSDSSLGCAPLRFVYFRPNENAVASVLEGCVLQ